MIDKEKDQTEIISLWVTPKTKRELDEAKDPKTKERILYEYARSMKSNMMREIEMLEEDVIRHKGLMAGYVKEFRELKNEQLKKTEDIWHDFEEDIAGLRSKSEEIRQSVEPLRKELVELRGIIRGIKSHDLDRLLDTINAINSSFYGETKVILQFLFSEYYHKEEK